MALLRFPDRPFVRPNMSLAYTVHETCSLELELALNVIYTAENYLYYRPRNLDKIAWVRIFESIFADSNIYYAEFRNCYDLFEMVSSRDISEN